MLDVKALCEHFGPHLREDFRVQRSRRLRRHPAAEVVVDVGRPHRRVAAKVDGHVAEDALGLAGEDAAALLRLHREERLLPARRHDGEAVQSRPRGLAMHVVVVAAGVEFLAGLVALALVPRPVIVDAAVGRAAVPGAARGGCVVHLDALGSAVVQLPEEARRLRGRHRVEVDPVRDRGEGVVQVEAVGLRCVKDHRLPPRLQSLHGGGAVHHALEAPIHAVPAAPHGLVGVGLHAGQPVGDATAEGAARVERHHLPIAGQLLEHQGPQLFHEVPLRADVVLENQRDRLPVGHGLRQLRALGAEVRGRATDGADDAARARHVLPRTVGVGLGALEVEILRYPAFLVGLEQHAGLADVQAIHEVEGHTDVVQALLHMAPPRAVRQAEDVDGHIRLEPLRGPRLLVRCPIPHGAVLSAVAELRVLQRPELERDRDAALDGEVLHLGPSESVRPPSVAAPLLEADPTPVSTLHLLPILRDNEVVLLQLSLLPHSVHLLEALVLHRVRQAPSVRRADHLHGDPRVALRAR
mmetsp:Transcript_933/g.2981  ORF Transcript_933/g.2981 Transcript_933/m.2981 type:complete len:526 (-) Transcript_933:866-2443(-)